MSPITYHAFGLPTGWTWGDGTPHTRSLDLDGRLTSYPLGTVNQTLSYDAASRLTGIAGSTTKAYGYDALDRLTSVTAPGINQTYSYDPNGNRLSETLGAQATSYSYAPGSNRLQSRTQGTTQNYTYDPAGNLIAAGIHTYAYDARGRMVQSTTGALMTSYRYNGLGERVSKTAPGSTAVSRRFVYDEMGHLIGEYDDAGTPIQETVYLGDLPVAVLSGTDGLHYVHADQINTPRATTDTQGAVVWRWESDPFGIGAPDQDPDGDTLSFVYNLRMPGQYFDAETGLHYNYFRDYDPSTGRFIQSDPIGLAGGLNTYAYVDSNPISFYDPVGYGKTGATVGGAIGGIAGGVAGGIIGGAGGAAGGTLVAPGFGTIGAGTAGAVEGTTIGGIFGAGIGAALGSAIEDLCKSRQDCPPCKLQDGTIVAVGTIAFRWDKYPANVTKHGVAGDHLNLYKANQNPNNCQCFWQPIGAVPPPPKPGWIPIQPFAN